MAKIEIGKVEIHVHKYGVIREQNGKFIFTPTMTSEETAAFIPQSPAQLSIMRKFGTGPPFKQISEGRIVYHVEDVIYWIKSRPSGKCKYRGGKGRKAKNKEE